MVCFGGVLYDIGYGIANKITYLCGDNCVLSSHQRRVTAHIHFFKESKQAAIIVAIGDFLGVIQVTNLVTKPQLQMADDDRESATGYITSTSIPVLGVGDSIHG